jgi:hypothetical protein
MAVMQMRNYTVTVKALALFLLCFSVNSYSEYIEGIDTTSGSVLDSAFGITGGSIASYRYYNLGQETYGYLHCSYDDINMAPDTIRMNYDVLKIENIFVAKNEKTGTYAKVQIVEKLSDSRYVFKYGKNITPNDRMLVPSNYDRSIKYKPNNLYNWRKNKEAPNPTPDTLTWDPPLPNDNHIIGYILYATNSPGTTLDTSKPIDPTQWDSVAFYPSDRRKAELNSMRLHGCYINLVALYEEGKSEFIDGWTMLNILLVGVWQQPSTFTTQNKKISITSVPNGCYIRIPFFWSPTEPLSLSVFNPNGSLCARGSAVANKNVFFNTTDHAFSKGLYILRAEFPDRSVITQPFTITR